MTKKFYEADPKELEKLWNRMTDWLLFNLEEIKSYIREMIYLGSGIVSGAGAAPENDASLELNVIIVNEAMEIIAAVITAIKQLEPEDFDIYIDRYHHEMIYSKIAEWEEIAEITVKRHIQKIRDTVKNYIDKNDIELETIVRLKDKLRYVCRKKVA
ncbi:MAG: sigma-70 family RNA polymerase sigma factor [Firmicutes bacterium]|nr:sigma-70 family RNA polymerase sigma factor [Bacillota bacterium]